MPVIDQPVSTLIVVMHVIDLAESRALVAEAGQPVVRASAHGISGREGWRLRDGPRVG
jgi:hypothetical protein